MKNFRIIKKQNGSMVKIFYSPTYILENSILLAKKIAQSNFIPTIIFSVARGGAYVGAVINEFFRAKGHKTKYGIIFAHSYAGINKAEDVQIEGWAPDPSSLGQKERILIVDDIVDRGKTLFAILQDLESRTRGKFRWSKEGLITKKKVAVASLDYKPKNPDAKPDFFISMLSKNSWIVYPHELADMSKDEQKELFGDIV